MSEAIKLVPVNLGEHKVMLPVVVLKGENPGKTLLITAGSDGDEYAGIEAAYRVIKEFSSAKFSGQLIVIPILNLPGFRQGISLNPLDQKFPKRVFPGKCDGTASERLIDWLNKTYLQDTSCWLDLHGGAIDETLEPFIFLYETRNSSLNKLIWQFARSLGREKLVVERPGSWTKAELLAQKSIAYLITEAGCGGERSEKAMQKHLNWTKRVMGVLGMIRQTSLPLSASQAYRKVISYRAEYAGFWYPKISKDGRFFQGETLGEIFSLNQVLLSQIKAKKDGVFLWGKRTMNCSKGEILLETGCQKEVLKLDISD